MNKNKYLLPAFLMLFLSLTLWGCRKNDLPAKPTPSVFSAGIDLGTFSKSGGKANINISAGTNGWWIVVPDEAKSWCVITPVYGGGDNIVPVTIGNNTTGVTRTIEIIVNSTYNLPPVKLLITQGG